METIHTNMDFIEAMRRASPVVEEAWRKRRECTEFVLMEEYVRVSAFGESTDPDRVAREVKERCLF